MKAEGKGGRIEGRGMLENTSCMESAEGSPSILRVAMQSARLHTSQLSRFQSRVQQYENFSLVFINHYTRQQQ